MAEVRPSIKAGAEQPPALVTDGSVSQGGCVREPIRAVAVVAAAAAQACPL